ncbi:hypothetical protein JZ751_011113 [Albula glossodonta]|uniref:Uncharacterized protein n=1 Tax=Albula glossodonta TaxID=121402 RepID=A0A8T2NU06_9TELE|nr:hypothetical protein JZ751_011113 [Albula glossodonta]
MFFSPHNLTVALFLSKQNLRGTCVRACVCICMLSLGHCVHVHAACLYWHPRDSIPPTPHHPRPSGNFRTTGSAQLLCEPGSQIKRIAPSNTGLSLRD